MQGKITVIIPARMASSRFPGKPLAKIMGLEMIEHTRRRVALCKDLAEVIIATCDKEIKETVEGYAGKVIMTAHTHERCTDRVAEAAQKVDADIIVNVQADEPMVTPEMITRLVEPLLLDKKCKATNLVSPIDNEEDFLNPNLVKAVCDTAKNILYFSREPIPSVKKTKEQFMALRQLGIVGFTKDFLLNFCRLPQMPLEKRESVDMLRALEHGYRIKAVIVKEKICGVDTMEDLKRVEDLMRNDNLLASYMGEQWVRF